MRAKIGCTVDPHLLHAVDSFLLQHPGRDRSSVIDEALLLWLASQQERAMEEQFSGPELAAEREERSAWQRMQAASAERIFRSS